MSNPSLLVSILAHARAGAVDQAWGLFQASGLASSDAPAVLTAKGRLLKDRAVSTADKGGKRDLYRQAAGAYLRAAEQDRSAYPLINAASLSLLAGDGEAARHYAQGVLAAPDEEHETPYYRGATRAEALLVLGHIDEARSALVEAIARAPEAWEDHASTLRQFGLLLGALGQDAAWLEPFRPPRTLHFAGHMTLAPDDDATVTAVARVLVEARVGFGYGALAAGSDIVIAEALLAHGAELHVILPADVDVFRERSVAPHGEVWVSRFDAVLASADSLRVVAEGAGAIGALSIQLASEVAMGLAVMSAGAMMTRPLQLMVLDAAEAEQVEAGASGLAWAAWGAAERQQILISAPRDREPQADWPAEANRRLAATLMVRLEPGEGTEATLDAARDLEGALATGPALLSAPGWSGQAVSLVYATVADAALAAKSVLNALGVRVRIAGHYGVMLVTKSRLGEGLLVLGPETDLAPAILASTLPGAINVSFAFAAALHATTPGTRTIEAGELAGVPLYALK